MGILYEIRGNFTDQNELNKNLYSVFRYDCWEHGPNFQEGNWQPLLETGVSFLEDL